MTAPAVQCPPWADLKDLVASRLVPVVAHVIATVGGRRAEVEDVAQDTNNSQQAPHLSFVAAGQATEKPNQRGYTQK